MATVASNAPMDTKRQQQRPVTAAAPDAPDVDDGRHFVNAAPDFDGGIGGPLQLLTQRAGGSGWGLSVSLRSRVQAALDGMLADSLPDMLAVSTASSDRSVYTGAAGVAYALWHLARTLPEPRESQRLLGSARDLMRDLSGRVDCRRPSFLCGDAGVLALTAVLHWDCDRRTAEGCVQRLLAMQAGAASTGPDAPPNELLFGRTGYLFALAFVAWQLGSNNGGGLPEATRADLVAAARAVARRTLADGAALWRERIGSGGEAEGLMYEWHDSAYFGAAHGLCGILTVLTRVIPSLGLADSEVADFRRRAEATVKFLRRRQFRSLNFPSSMGSDRDRLVHWCHGAPGFALMFLSTRDMEAAMECASVVWRRGLLHKGDGLCHGVSGNAYVFLRLHGVTGEPLHLHRAAAFADFMLAYTGPRRIPDRPMSLFEGLAGKMCFMADLLRADTCPGDPVILFPAAELPDHFIF